MSAVEGAARHLETARKRLWDMEGQLAILEALKANYSLDGLMKRRLEQKISAKTAQVAAEEPAVVVAWSLHGRSAAVAEKHVARRLHGRGVAVTSLLRHCCPAVTRGAGVM